MAGREAARRALGLLPETAREAVCMAGDGVRYVCPQRLSLGADVDENASLYFRVSSPVSACEIEVRSDQRTIASRRLDRANPGEMEKATIRLRDVTGSCVTVSVKPVEGGK